MAEPGGRLSTQLEGVDSRTQVAHCAGLPPGRQIGTGPRVAWNVTCHHTAQSTASAPTHFHLISVDL